MYRDYSIFCSHLDLSHSYWKKLLKPGDCVIDATCGNGKDTLILAQHVLTESAGCVYAIDIQEVAIRTTHQLLLASLSPSLLSRVHFVRRSHCTFPEEILPQSVALVVYNLGYLPGSDKKVKTQIETTQESLKNALDLLQPGGCLSVTCYPGHSEGAQEEEGLRQFAATLDPKEWSCSQHSWLNRRAAPCLLLIQKARSLNGTLLRI